MTGAPDGLSATTLPQKQVDGIQILITSILRRHSILEGALKTAEEGAAQIHK